MELSLKISATLPPAIMENKLVFTGEADIGLRSATLDPISQVVLVDC